MPQPTDDAWDSLEIVEDPNAVDLDAPVEEGVDVNDEGAILGYQAPPGKPVKVKESQVGKEAKRVAPPLSFRDTVQDVAESAISGVGKAAVSAVTMFESEEDTADLKSFMNNKRMFPGGETTAGAVTMGITEFTAGLVGASKITGPMNLVGKGATALKTFIHAETNAAISSAVAFQGSDDRLSNLVDNHAGWFEPITDALKADPSDSDFEGRLKAATESVLTGIVAAPVIAGFGVALKYWKLGKAAKTDAAKEAIEAEAAVAIREAEKAAEVVEATKVTEVPLPAEPTIPRVAPISGTKALQESGLVEPKGKASESLKVADPVDPNRTMFDYIEARVKEGATDTPLDLYKYIKNRDIDTGEQGNKFYHTIATFAEAMGPKLEALTAERSWAKTKLLGEAMGIKPELVRGNLSKLASTMQVADGISSIAWDTAVGMTKEIGAWSDLLTHKAANGIIDALDDEKLYTQVMDFADFFGDLVSVSSGAGRLLRAQAMPSGQAAGVGFKADIKATQSAAKVAKIREGRKLLFSELAEINKSAIGRTDALGGLDIFAKQSVVLVKIAKNYVDEGIVHVGDFIKAYRADHGDEAKVFTDEQLTKVFSEAAPKTKGDVLKSKIKQAITEAGGPEAVRSFAKKLSMIGPNPKALLKVLTPDTPFEKLVNVNNEVWFNAVLLKAGILTSNVIGGINSAMVLPSAQLAGAAIRAPFTKSTMGIKEATATFTGMLSSISDAFIFAKKAWKTEANIMDPQASNVGSHKKITAEYLGIKGKGLGKFVDGLGQTVRLASRGLLTGDEFIKNIAGRGARIGTLTRDALEAGKTGAEIDAYVKEGMAESFVSAKTAADPTSKYFGREGMALDADSVSFAREVTLTSELGTFGTWMQDIGAKIPLIAPFAPFIRVSTNSIKTFASYSGVFSPLVREWRADLAAGGARSDRAVGKVAMGSAFWAASMYAYMQGNLTPKGPTTKAMRLADEEAGQLQNSISVGDSNLDIGRYSPWASFPALVASVGDGLFHADDRDKHNFAMLAAIAMGEVLANRTVARSAHEFLGAVLDPAGEGEDYVSRRITSYIPGAITQATSMFDVTGDDILREVQTVWEAIQAKTPGLSKTLAPQRNFMGEPIKKPTSNNGVLANLTGIPNTTKKHDPFLDEIARFNKGFANVPQHKGNLDLRTYEKPTPDGKKNSAWDRWQELLLEGDVKAALVKRFNSPEYKALPEDQQDGLESGRFKSMQGILHAHQKTAFAKMLKEYPDLQKDLGIQQKNKTAFLMGGTKALQDFANSASNIRTK